MFSWGVYNPGDMANHDCWEVNLLSSIHKVNKTLIYSIRKIAALTSRDDILNNEPKEQLMKRSHVTFLDRLGCCQPCLLVQAQSCPPEYTHQSLQQEHPKLHLDLWHWISVFFFIDFTCHHSIGDIAICIKFGQIWDRTLQLGVCKQFQPLLSPEFVQKHLQTLFLKVCHIRNFTLHHILRRNLANFEVVGAAFFAFLELGSSGSSLAGPCLGTCLGEIFPLETVFLEGVCTGVIWTF